MNMQTSIRCTENYKFIINLKNILTLGLQKKALYIFLYCLVCRLISNYIPLYMPEIVSKSLIIKFFDIIVGEMKIIQSSKS